MSTTLKGPIKGSSSGPTICDECRQSLVGKPHYLAITPVPGSSNNDVRSLCEVCAASVGPIKPTYDELALALESLIASIRNDGAVYLPTDTADIRELEEEVERALILFERTGVAGNYYR